MEKTQKHKTPKKHGKPTKPHNNGKRNPRPNQKTKHKQSDHKMTQTYTYTHIKPILNQNHPKNLTQQQINKIKNYVQNKQQITNNPNIQTDQTDQKWLQRSKKFLERAKYENKKQKNQ